MLHTHCFTLLLQLSGRDYDEKTDIYSLGIMLFEMSHPSFRTAMERTIVRDMPLYTLQL
jgi:serine/threonine protein kinase